ncbi:universal stress protein [Streptomyces sp. TLI_146]|uniref:universal stress protein n=1 Tax=Streptomyces sp. TLI_146 TaxID=1938858 RepID=UPI000C70DB7F
MRGNGPDRGTGGDVVLGLDFSRPRDALIDYAVEAARAHGGALRVVHTWSPPPRRTGAEAAEEAPLPPPPAPRIYRRNRACSDRDLERHPEAKGQ